ncbi:MAG: IgGFc-binding protein [Deltaproteobacteria bacterium]|nr:IgGFc-binding protein [Nannocystaceae bacterium]
MASMHANGRCGAAIASLAVAALACGDLRDDPAAMSSDGSDATTPGTTLTAADSTSSGGVLDDTGGKLDVGPGADLGGGSMAVTCADARRLPTNQGCEFWAVDLPNVSATTLITPPQQQQFAVVVSNPSSTIPAQIEIFVGDSDAPVAEGPLPPATIRVFQLDAMSITPAITSADGLAFRIASDSPIVAYQFQPLDNVNPVYSNDATILFPTHVLGGDYTAITGDAVLVGQDSFSSDDANTGAFVSVVATEDDTTVTLFPTALVHDGDLQDVVLDRGQVLTTISSQRGAPRWGNLSGTRVVADKPVAVFSGSVATSEPADAEACCADHVEHQMLPLTAWGTAYLAAPAAAPTGGGGDATQFRITGAFDGTELVYDPARPTGAPASIDAYETVAFVTDAPFSVRASDDAKSFAVAQFLLSNQYFGELLRPGDPSMILVPAAAQFEDRYSFLVPQGYASDYVTVVRPVGSTTSLDGIPLAPASFAPLAALDEDYELAHLLVEPGGHAIEGDAPFGITIVGYAQDVSYGYVGGSGVGVIGTAPPPPAG